MATANQHIGRLEGVGIGIETTPGTAVAPSVAGWMRWLDNDVNNTTDIITNESAMGTVAVVSDSEVVRQYAKGKLKGKITDVVFGYFMTGFFGTPTTTGTGPYTHTFSMSNSSVPVPAMTLSIPKAVDSFRHAFAVFDSIEVSVDNADWVMFSASVKARVGVPQADTPAIATETEFTSAHCAVKIATNASGIAAAPALKVIKAQITMERNSDPFIPFGDTTLVEFDRLGFTAKGEFTVRHTDSQYNTDFLANAAKAFQFSANNNGKSLTFNASKVRYREIGRSTNRDDIVTQVISFECEVDPAANYPLIQPVLVNAKTNYLS